MRTDPLKSFFNHISVRNKDLARRVRPAGGALSRSKLLHDI